MIELSTIKFLSSLAKNNDREWFQANKTPFNDAQDNLTAFAGQLIGEIGKFDEAVADIDPKACVFRIYRDVRFSKDKSPYKVNLSAYIIPGGLKSMQPGYYFHVQPGASFFAGGKYQPDGPELLKIRTAISERPDEFLKIIDKKSFVDQVGELWDDRLKSVPKGFDADHPAVGYLKLRQFTVHRQLPENKVVTSPEFPKQLVKIAKEMYPLIEFLRAALTAGV